MRRTIPEIQVDQALIGNAHLLGYAFEISNGVFIQTDRYLLGYVRCVWVLSGVCEIVFFSHRA